ncbi:hypothetical protein [Suttonella ornithocola]|uniref:Adhesin HecA family 20-residue repeat (Two copies) n=1 Tax=Suttonella ornithocola TaxID=279832 RepID=A0A380MRB8_9GAMM|nr:hypothetical protein [Suttonella ornithocola]SUO95150.1 adhesin HecA family 20-residue repeat (two copies) [Suttonella ornithocola]
MHNTQKGQINNTAALTLSLTEDLKNKGEIHTDKLQFNGKQIDNDGKILSQEAYLQAQHIDNKSEFIAEKFSQLSADTVNNAGKLGSAEHIHLQTKQLRNEKQAIIISQKDMSIDSPQVNNQGTLQGKAVTITAEDKLTNAGDIQSGEGLRLHSAHIVKSLIIQSIQSRYKEQLVVELSKTN